MSTLADVLRRRFIDDADRPFLRAPVEMSYARLAEAGAAYAHVLLGYRRDSEPLHVGILADNVPEFALTIVGTWLAGGTAVPLNTTRRGHELARDAAHTDCSVVVGQTEYLELLEADLPTLAIGDDLDSAVAAVLGKPDPKEPLNPTQPGFLFFTSGTTGAPKAIKRSHTTIMLATQNIADRLGLTHDDVGLINMPMFHAAANMMCLIPAIQRAASVAIRPKFSVSGFLPDLRRHGVTYWAYTGKPLAYLMASDAAPDSSDNPLRIATGNEGNSALCDAFAQRFACEVIDVYGATEGGVGIVRRTGDPAGSLGMPPDGVIVVDENDEECGVGVIGEIVNTSTMGSFEGYYKNPEADAIRRKAGWYRSGDLAWRDADGYLFFAGRQGDWARVDGENMTLAPIEALLEQHPDVVVAGIVAVPADDGVGDRLIAVLEAAPTASADEIVDWLREHPDCGTKWVPSEVRVVAEIPKTGSHKLDRRALRSQVLETA